MTRTALTHQDFPNYSVPMDTEWAALEEKIKQAVSLCRRLREENTSLRQQLAELSGERKNLSDRIDGARNRLENLLRQIPE